MSPEFYRRVWNIDLMNKIIDERIPWNLGMTKDEIEQGFQELMVSGVYERDFFGDMMMAGIACGVRQRILIFNTNVNTTHDPISVVDPREYGGVLDSEIPVVVGYNLVHYESMHPVDDQDIEETVKLTNSYTASPPRYLQEYGFTRNDMSYLVTPCSSVQSRSNLESLPRSSKETAKEQAQGKNPKKKSCQKKR